MKGIFGILIGLVAIAVKVRAQTTSLPIEKCPFVECNCQMVGETEISVNCNSPTNEQKFPTRHDRFNTSIQIYSLTISNYKFSAIPSNIFSGLRIGILSLDNNDMKTIQEASFTGIIGLEELQITRQNVETIQPKSLDPISNTLVRMTLQNDQTAKSILVDSAVTFTQLVRLTLQSLTELNPNMFTNLPELFYLTLSSVPNLFDNPLTGYFTKNPKLGFIILRNNEIKKISNVLGWLDNVKNQIQHFDLSYNQIEEIPDEINSFSNIAELNLYANQIRSISSTTFRGLTELSDLILGQNLMKAPRDAFKNNKKLTYAYLASNLFNEIHDFTGTRVNWLSYESQNGNLVELKDYEFDFPRSTLTDSLRLRLFTNDITKFGNRVFCSRSNTTSLVYIAEFDIDYKPFTRMDLCLLRQLGLRNGKSDNTELNVINPSNEPLNLMCKCEYFEFLKRYNIKLSLFGCSIDCKDVVSSSYLDSFDKDCDAKEEFRCVNSNGGDNNGSLSNFGFNTFMFNFCLLLVFIFRYIKV